MINKEIPVWGLFGKYRHISLNFCKIKDKFMKFMKYHIWIKNIESRSAKFLLYNLVTQSMPRVRMSLGSVLENTETSKETPDWKKAKVTRFRETCLVGR